MMIDRFYDGDSANNSIVNDSLILPKAQYYGGDIKGITQKIKNAGYFQKLGCKHNMDIPNYTKPIGCLGSI